MSLFCAAWTVASIAGLAAGAASLTYYETAGSRGVLESGAETVYPLYHVIADLCELRGATVHSVESSAPLAVDLIAVTDPFGVIHALIANATPATTRVTIRGLPEGRATMRGLCVETYITACVDPGTFRLSSAEVETPRELELEPYEVMRLDVLR